MQLKTIPAETAVATVGKKLWKRNREQNVRCAIQLLVRYSHLFYSKLFYQVPINNRGVEEVEVGGEAHTAEDSRCIYFCNK